MRRWTTILVFGGTVAALWAGPTRIEITAPQVTAWTQVIGGISYTASPTERADLNDKLRTAFQDLEDSLNNDKFSNLGDFPQLTKGFANANAATFDNVSLLGYQTYDYFAAAVGTNLGLTVPSFGVQAVGAYGTIVNDGDVMAGLATGGLAAKVGLNLGAWVPNLYGTLKAGFVPSFDAGGISFQQLMVGVGADYTLVPRLNFLAGLFQWRGISLGTGMVFNGSTTNMKLPIGSYGSAGFTATANGQTVNGTAAATNTVASLSVKNSSFVVPLDVSTSVQLFWLLNLGLGAGLDLSFAQAQISKGATSDLEIYGVNGATVVPGSVTLVSSDSQGGGDFFLPRIAASVGFNVAIFKLDIPMSYYPFSKAVSVGLTTGFVW